MKENVSGCFFLNTVYMTIENTSVNLIKTNVGAIWRNHTMMKNFKTL